MLEFLSLDGPDDLRLTDAEDFIYFALDSQDDVSDCVLYVVAIQPSFIAMEIVVANCMQEHENWFEGYVIVDRSKSRSRKFSLSDIASDEVTETVTLFMRNASRYKLLTLPEERMLVERMASGDEEAKNMLITSNLRLVVKIAHDFKGRGLSLDDLVAEGSVGLMKGVSKYQLNHGAKVSSYVAWWIKQAMHRAIANQSRLIRVPVQSAGKWFKIKRAVDALEDMGITNPLNSEIAEKAGLSERTVSNLRGKMATVMSLDDKPDNSTMPYSNTIADTAQQENAEKVETMSILYDAISQLSPREQFIIKTRFGLDNNDEMPLPAISKAVGRTRERVRQIERAALDKLRCILGDQFDLHINMA